MWPKYSSFYKFVKAEKELGPVPNDEKKFVEIGPEMVKREAAK